MKKLSVVLATRNEEVNIGKCLESVASIADEIVIVDENSEDRIREIAEKFGARVYKVDHEPIFHKTKQKALDLARGDWILQLDADEVVSAELANEIKEVIEMTDPDIRLRRPNDLKKWQLFQRHQRLIEERNGQVGKTGEIVAFFLPRLNMFLGKPLRYAGVYPDPAIRLVKKDKAWFPAKSVHEIMEIEGEVAWLFNDLEHHDSPTLSRYLARLNRYTELKAEEFKKAKVAKNIFGLIYYSLLKPTMVFLLMYLRHKGIMDGPRGFLWSFFSATHFPIAYFKFYLNK